jgi:formamidopyrimidine-DNA glycosylase
MPELPEVETVRRELEPWLIGRTIVRAERVDAPIGPKYAHLAKAAGQRIEAVGRRGKFIVMPLSHGSELIVHLGMTGIVTPERPRQHLRVVMTLSGRAPKRLFFQDARRFGRLLVVPAGDYRSLPTLAALGPEPLSDAFTPRGLHEALRKSRMAIKSLLLTQRPVAGLGNIYIDETLWRAGIHPKLAACRITSAQAERIHHEAVDVLRAAIIAQGTTINDYRTVNGNVGEYVNSLAVYGHEGDPCRRCGATLEKIVLGARGTHYCPRCQRMRAG